MLKQLKYALLAGIVAVSSVGCEDQFLTQSNPNAITDMTFWKTSADFTKAVNAMYGALQLPAVSGANFLTFEPLRSDFAGCESWYSDQLTYDQLRWDNSNAYVASRWSELYVGVYRANQILYYVDGCDALSAADKEMITAQAKYIRGYCYFLLANSYNGAMIIDVLPKNPSEMHKPFSAKADVISTMVIPDLEYAKSVLPQTWDAANQGRATWGAATAVLGKTYLYDHKFEEAGKEFAEIINSGLYSLVPVFADNFTVDNEFNSESVFEVSFSDSFKPGTNAQQHDEIDGSEAIGIAGAFASITGAGGYNSVLPSYGLQEMFVTEKEQMDPANRWTSSHVRSMRTYSTLAVEYGDGDYYKAPLTAYIDEAGNDVASKANFSYGQGAKVKKWTQWDRVEAESQNTGFRTGINYRAIRYADILLMYAECLLEAGDVDSAIPYIDQVRTRAGVYTLAHYMAENGGNIPQLHVSSLASGLTDEVNEVSEYSYVPANAENVMTHLRRVERPLEFAFEGHRWYDLVRWGIVKEVMDEGWAQEQDLGVYYNTDAGGNFVLATPNVKTYPLFLSQRVRPDFQKASQNYNSAAHDYFPIPSIETENNNAL